MTGRLKDTKGFEALFSASQFSIKSPSDALVCFIHAFLTSHHFACVGVSNKEVKKTELLPTGWSDSQEVYVLRYLNEIEAESYTMKALVIDGIMTVQLLRKSDDAVTTSNIKINNFTQEVISEFTCSYKDLRDLEVQLDVDLLRPFMGEAGPPPFRRDPPSPPQRFTDDPDPLRIGHGGYDPRPGRMELDDPFAVGRGDLDPINAGVGGGMIMDPFRRGLGRDPNAGLPPGCRLPPGAIPPGARFDPYGPPGIFPAGSGNSPGPSRFGPNPDHMRPPDYDDMFM